MQFDQAADHGGVGRLQAGLDAQFGFGGESGGADQAQEQGAEYCVAWAGAFAGKPAPRGCAPFMTFGDDNDPCGSRLAGDGSDWVSQTDHGFTPA
ncbi:hypothetical protein PMm318_A45560 [Pseudomonas moorei]